MATTTIQDQLSSKLDSTKPSAIIKPLQQSNNNNNSSKAVGGFKKPLLVPVQHSMNTRSRRDTTRVEGGGGTVANGGPVKAVRGRREVGSSRSRCTTSRQAPGVQNTAIAVKQEEDEERNGGRREGRVAASTKTRAATTRIPKVTKQDQTRPTTTKTGKQKETSALQRPVLTRMCTRNTTSTVTVAEKVKKLPRSRPAVRISKPPPQVTELAAEDGDIRKTDGRFVTKCSKKSTTATTNTTGIVVTHRHGVHTYTCYGNTLCAY